MAQIFDWPWGLCKRTMPGSFDGVDDQRGWEAGENSGFALLNSAERGVEMTPGDTASAKTCRLFTPVLAVRSRQKRSLTGRLGSPRPRGMACFHGPLVGFASAGADHIVPL
jgi:hypothetical protein